MTLNSTGLLPPTAMTPYVRYFLSQAQAALNKPKVFRQSAVWTADFTITTDIDSWFVDATGDDYQ